MSAVTHYVDPNNPRVRTSATNISGTVGLVQCGRDRDYSLWSSVRQNVTCTPCRAAFDPRFRRKPKRKLAGWPNDPR